jgi:hypothetical protein
MGARVIQLFLLAAVLFAVNFSILLAQDEKALKEQILRQTNVQALEKLAAEIKVLQEQERQKAIEAAKKKGWPIRGRNSKGQTYELQRLDERGNPVYYITSNLGAAKTSSTNKIWPSGVMGLNLTGQGMKAAVWDGGAVRLTHQEFGGRVTQADNAFTLNDHATHVTGTVAAAGVVPQAKGMAFQSKIDAYDWNQDLSEMFQAAAQGLMISNHSYGATIGWQPVENFTDINGQAQTNKWVWNGDISVSTTEDSRAGIYDAKAHVLDRIARLAPYYLMHWAAGNDRGETLNPGDPYFTRNDTGGYVPANLPTPPPPDGPFNLVSSQAAAKNVLTVGAVHEIPNGYNPLGSPSQVVMSNFSCWGPTDDGRIKPDIVAKGVNVYSASDTADNKYFYSDGTSMASPAVAGSLLLLQQHNFNKHGVYLRAATLKALAIHTADEAGPAPGPDYMYGWGLLNTAKAAQLINDKDVTALFFEDSLLNQQSWTYKINTNGGKPLVATLVWADVPGPIQQVDQLNSPTKRLVNDLDLRISKGTTTHFPWKLNPNFNWKGQTGPTATKGDNDLDNVEQVFIDNPEPGCYTLTITHKGNLQQGPQHFSLIVSEVAPECKLTLSSNIQQGCMGQFNSGSVSITPSGGTPPYTFQWNTTPVNTTPSLAYVSPGNYTVRVASATGCCERTANISIDARPSTESNRGAAWAFGRSAGVNFYYGQPQIFQSGYITQHGCASIGDENGNLLFYTDGQTVYNAQHDTMANGVDLHGGANKGTQTSIIVPRPGSNNIYYIFTVDSFYSPRGLKYSTVDMNLGGGLGAVTTKNTALHSPVQEKISAVKHANGCDYWVIAREATGNNFRAYLVSSAGVSAMPVISAAGPAFPPLPYNIGLTQGQMKFSPDGKKLALAIFGAARIVVFDFNAATGQVSNTNIVDINLMGPPSENPYGIEFSPDSKVLYATVVSGATNRVLQFNLQAGNSAAVMASKTVLATSTDHFFRSMQLSVDGKIYIARFRNVQPFEDYLAVIDNPNTLGAGANFILDGLKLDGNFAILGLPNFVQSFFKPIEAEITNTPPVSFCPGDSVELKAKPNCDFAFQWLHNNVPIPGATQASYWAKQEGVYRVEVRNKNKCAAISPQEFFVSENPKPRPPLANVPNCLSAGTTATITFTADDEVRIYSQAQGGTPLATDNAPPYQYVTPSLASSTTYYAETFNSATGCKSDRVPFVVAVGTPPGAPSASGITICPNGLVSFTAAMGSPAGQSIELYTQAAGGVAVASASAPPYTLVAPTLSVSATTTLYIAARSANHCLSPRVPVVVTVSGTGQQPSFVSNAPVCQGQTLLLTAGGVDGATYTILGPGGFSQNAANASLPNITLADTGWYTAIAALPGCATTARLRVAVTPAPPTPAILSNSPVCLNTLLNLSASPQAGASYLWQGPYGFSSTDLASSVMITNTLQAGVYSLSVIANGCTSSVATANIHVGMPLPRPSIQSVDPCQGATLTLTATSIPGATYTWRGPAGFTATGTTVTRTNMQPNLAGVYTLTVMANGCTAQAFDTVNIQNPPPPVITSNGPIRCQGQNLQMTASGGPSGATYIWEGPNGYTATGASITRNPFNAASAGIYQVTYTVNGCVSNPAITEVEYVSAPAPAQPNAVSPINTCANAYVVRTITIPNPSGQILKLYTESVGGYPILTLPIENGEAQILLPAVTTNTTFYVASATEQGCESARRPIVVNVTSNPPMPTVTSNSPLCVGQTLQMTVNATGLTSHNWFPPQSSTPMTGGTMTSISKTNMQLSDAGVYLYLAAYSSDCHRVIEIPVEVFENNTNPPAVVTNSPVCVEQNLTLSVSPISGGTFIWSGPAGYSATGASVTRNNATAAMSGIYSVAAVSGSCTSAVSTIEVSVISVPTPTITINSPVCEGGELRLTASGPSGAIYQWKGPGNITYTGSQVAIANVSSTHAGTYSLIVIIGPCSSAQQTVAVNVSPAPTTPTVNPTATTVPIGSNVTITVANVNNANAVQLYTSPIGGAPIATDNTPPYNLTTPPTNGSVTYWVEAWHSILGCRSPRVPVIVNATEQTSVGEPSANNVMRCGEGGVTFTAFMGNPPGACIRLYTVATGGAAVSSTCNSPYLLSTPPITTTTTFYIESADANNQYQSSRTQVIAFIDKVGPPQADNLTLCSPSSATFTVEMGAPAGDRVSLYTAPTGGAPIATDNTHPYELTTPPLTAGCTTFYIEAENINNCKSSRSPVTACVQLLSAPSAANISVCSPSIVTFTASLGAGSPPGTRIYLYTQATGGNVISTAATSPYLLATSSSVTTNATFYIEAQSPGNCVSLRVPVRVIFDSQGVTPTVSSNSPVCNTDSLQLSASGVSGATYTWSGPNNYSATGANVSRFPLPPTAAGEYTVTATAGGCVSTATLNVTITPAPGAPTAQGIPQCITSGTTVTLTFSMGTPGGNSILLYSTIGSSTPIATLSSAPYQYTVPNITSTITFFARVSDGNCLSAPFPVILPVGTPPGPPSSPNASGCSNGVFRFQPTMGTPPGDLFLLYTQPTGGMPVSGAPVGSPFGLPVNNVTTTTTFYLAAVDTTSGCQSARVPVVATVTSVGTIPTITGDTTRCQGQNLLLTASGAGGFLTQYLWIDPNIMPPSPSVGATLNKQNLKPEDSGIYAVIAINPLNQCTTVATRIVTVIPTPPAPTVASNSPLCVGANLSLTASSSPPIPGAAYHWSGPAGFSATGATVTRNAVATSHAGNYLAYTVVQGCSSAASAVPVSVVNPPAQPVVSGDLQYCQGDTLLLNVMPVSGVTFAWNGPNNFSATGAEITRNNLELAHGGVYTVIAVVGSCSSSPKTIDVVVNPKPAMPTAQTDSPKCVGDNLNLTAAGASGPVFHWSGPAGFSATGATQTINLTSTNQGGVYSVIAVANGCTSDLATVSVTVNSPATVPTLISNSPVCQGKDLVLTVEGIANAEFIWSGPNNFAQTTTSPTLTRPAMQVANAGQYSVVAVTAGCTSQTGVANVVVNSLPPTPVASNDGPYCVGEDLVLNAQSSATDPNATFLWLGYDYIANGPINVTQYTKPNLTLAETGIYSLAVISQGCTSAFATTNVQVFSIPAPPTIDALHSNPICVGKTLTVSAVFLTDAQYIWSGPNNFAATNSTPVNSIQIPNITTANAGIYTLITVVNGCTASAATTFEIVVQDLFPAPTVSSDSPKCINQTLSLTVAAAPGFIYHWSGPNGFAATGAGPTFTRSNLTTADAGVYSVIGIQNGCSTQTATIPVTVNDVIPPAPTVTTNSPLCVGQDLQIRVIGTGTFNLTGPGGYSASGPGPIFTRPNASLGFNGTYSVTTTVDGCTSLAATTLVTVNSPPVANPSSNSPRCVGQTLFLNAASTVPGASFEWSGPGGYTSPNQNVQISNVTTAAGGVYTLTVSAPGCPAATATVSVTVVDAPPPAAATNSPVCTGGTLVLSAGSPLSGVTYLWSGPSGYSATTSANEVSRANVNSSAAGIYSVVAILGGCTSPVAVTEPVVIRFVPQPIAQFVNTSGTAPTSVCQGGSFRIAVTNTSAFEPGTTFIWQGPQGSMAHSADTYEVSAAQLSHAGAYRIWAVANGCTSIASLPVTVTVVPPPPTPSVTNNGPICEDAGEATLRVSPIPGVTRYQWSGPAGFSASGLQVTIPAHLANAGVYSVTAFSAEGCSSAAGLTTLVITPKPALPIISSNSPVCQGQALHLTIDGPAGANYTLRGPNGYAVSGAQTEYSRLNMNASFAGLYSLTATVSGCVTPEVTHKVNVLPSPPRPLASNNGPRCEGERLVLTASGGGAGATYRWSGPEGFTALGATATLSNISSSQAGVYSVVAIAEGCTSAPSLTTVEVTPLPNVTLVSNSPVCQGSALIITANNAPSGAYFEMRGPNRYFAAGNYVVFNRPNIQPEDSGAYTLTVSAGACRGISSSINIAVKPVPTLESLLNNGPLCQGQELRLSTIAPPLESYIWRLPNNATLVTSDANYIVSAASLANSGVYHVSGVINGCTTNAASTVVAIQAAPAAPSATNNGPICIMGNATLQAQAIRGVTYLWSGPDGFVSTEQTFTRQITDPSMAGVYTVVAIANGCTSEPATTTLEVIDLNLSPEVSGHQSLCVGANLQLTSSGLPSGVSYRWEGPAAFSSDEPNPVINDVQTFNSGVYYLLAFGQGCTSRVAEVEVTIRPQPPMPLANFTGNLCKGGAIRLSATTIPDAQYYWQGPAGFESFEQNPALSGITPTQSGTYSVIAYIGNCSSEAGTVSVTIRSAPNPPVANNSGPYCAGQTIALSASSFGGATYLWSGPGGFTSTQQNATRANSKLSDAGIYSVVAIVNGCTSSPATTLVQVRPSQAPLSASSNSPVCQGQTVYLSTPLVAGASYLWSGPLGFSSTDREPVIPNPTPAQTGVYAVRLIMGACTSNAISTNVFIQPKPQNIAISSNSPICAGQTLLLTATSVSGAVYQWSGPSGFSASQSNVIINNATVGVSGVYRLRVSVGNCVAPLDSVTVVVHPAAPPAPRVSSNSPLCQGQAIQLFASTPSAATFNWTGPYGFSSTLQNPSIPNALPEFSGVYTLTVSNGPCSAPPVTVNVSVTPTPSVSISANSLLCEGGSLELSATPISGARYQWSGPNNFTSTQLVNTLAPATIRMSGVYTLEVALGSCVSRVTRQIQVSPVPVAGPITSNSPVCAGGILTLSAPQVLGASYEWKGPNGFVSTLQNPAPIAPVTSQNAGIYSLITILNGCTSAVATHEVRVIGITTMPDIVSNAPVCEGDLLQLSATLLPGVVYQWQGPNNFSASIANPIRSAMRLSDAGIYTLNVTTASCRTPISLTVEVGVKPLPPAPIASSNSPICNDGALQLSANSPSATQFYWTGPNGFMSAQQNPIISNPTPVHSGTYHVQAIAQGCTSAATAVRVSVAQAPQTPRISVSQSTVCEGSRLLLTASVGDGSSILWSGPSGFSSTAPMVTLAPVTAGQGGTYSAVAILGACTSSVVTQNISVIPFAPVIEAGSNSPVCQGQSIELTASSVAGAVYSWRGPLNFVSSLQNPIITSALPTQSGVYTLEVRVGSCTQVIEVPVTVRAAQGEISATASTPICEGQPLRLAANELPGATYVWSGPLGFSATGPVVQREGLTSLNSGAYVLNASINGCPIAEIMLDVEILPGPGAVVAQNNGPLCAGNTLSLLAQTQM